MFFGNNMQSGLSFCHMYPGVQIMHIDIMMYIHNDTVTPMSSAGTRGQKAHV